ncbi:hypothetical protein LguiA_019315 [Lonicera macranthoides]
MDRRLFEAAWTRNVEQLCKFIEDDPRTLHVVSLAGSAEAPLAGQVDFVKEIIPSNQSNNHPNQSHNTIKVRTTLQIGDSILLLLLEIIGKPKAPFKTPRKQAPKPSVIKRSPRLMGKFKLPFSCTSEKTIALSDDEPDFSDPIEPKPLQPKSIELEPLQPEPLQTDPIQNRKGKELIDETDVYLPMICGLPNVGFSGSQSFMNDSGPYDYEYGCFRFRSG